MDKITPRVLQAFVNSLAKDGANEKTGKPLAPKTIRHNLSFVSDVFSYAVRMGMLSDNPCSKVIIPKGEVKEKQIYSPEEMEQLLIRLHCNSSTTLNVYSHQFQNSQARVAEAMDGILNFLPKNKKQE